MMYKVQFKNRAIRSIEMFKMSEPSAYKKLEALLHELEEHPRTGTGKPEALRGNLAGYWSRRITHRHRLVYTIDDDRIIVLVIAVAGHYD
jgi:toxin YoeB